MDEAPSRPDREPMRPIDRAWLRMDEPGRNLMVINGVLLFHEPLDAARVHAMLADRLAGVRRFRQLAEKGRWSWGWRWRDDPGFDVARHVVEEVLPAPGGEAELRRLVADRMQEDLPRDRPLWRLHLVQGWNGRGSAMLWRLHHCMGDGIALMVLLLSLTDLEPGGDLDEAAWQSDNPLATLFAEPAISPREAFRVVEQIMPEAARLMARPAEALARANPVLLRIGAAITFLRMALRWPDPRTRFKGRLAGHKRVAWSGPIPLAEVAAARQRMGGTLNDVLINALAGGLRRYLESKGDATAGLTCRAVVPVSLRPVEEMNQLGNQFGLVFLPLPIGIADPLERLAVLRSAFRSLKGSLEPLVVRDVLWLLGYSPQLVQDVVLRIFGTKGTAVLTSVPGPARTLYCTGRAIDGLVFWVPQSGRLAMGISIMSYAGEVRLGVMTDAGVVPDPEAVVAAFEAELAAMDPVERVVPMRP